MLSDLQLWLNAQMVNATPGLALDRVLHDLILRWPPVALLDGLLNDQEALEDVRRRSYRHENGYDRIEVLSGQDHGYGLRIHAWWGDVSGEEERVHGHPWSFASMVLAGLLRVEQFVVSQSGQSVQLLHYTGPNTDGTRKLTPAGVARILPILRISIPAGIMYSAHHEILHRVWTDPGRDTITLMLHGDGVAYPSPVFQDHARIRNGSDALTQPRFELAQLSGCLQRIRERVAHEFLAH